MSFLKKIGKAIKSTLKTGPDILKQVAKNPTRLITGVDPISTKAWNSVLGTNYDPIVNMYGGPTEATLQRVGANGLARGLFTAADTVAGIWGGGEALGALQGGLGSVASGGGAFSGAANAANKGLDVLASAAGLGGGGGNSMDWGALLSLGASLGGSLMQSNAVKSAARSAADASKFSPYSTANLFGSAMWDPSTNTLIQGLSPFSQQLTGALQQQALGTLNSPISQLGLPTQAGAYNDLMGAYTTANGMQMDQGLYDSIMGGYGNAVGFSPQSVSAQMLGLAPSVGAQAAFAPNSAGLNLSNLFNQMGNSPYALEQMQRGRNLLGNNYDQLAANQLGLMRQQAAPQEERATNSLMQRLFNQGRLGSTGGGRDIAAFAEGLSNADTQRQLSAQDFARGLYQQDQNLGANLFSGGAGLQQQGLGLAGQLGSNINSQTLARDQYNLGAGQFNSSLGLQAALANQGAQTSYDLANQSLGLNAAMANQSAGLSANSQLLSALGAMGNFGTGWQNTSYNRANDAIARAEGMFGFGNQLSQQGVTNSSNYLNLLSGIAQQQNALAQLGITSGGAQAQAGANQGQFLTSAAGSPFGSFFSGLGNAYLGSDAGQTALANLFRTTKPDPGPVYSV